MTRNRSNNPRGPSRRRGYTTVELTMSVLVLVVAMGISVRVLGWVGAERRSADRRQWAIQEAANVMERVAAEPFEGVTAEKARAIAAGSDADKRLPGGSWDVDVEKERDSPVPATRVSVRLRWKDRAGGWVAPVRLTAWVYRRGDAS